jgi:predicted dehydrogenase
MRKLNVAMIGYKFMGRAHSNAWRQVGRFFETPYDPVMKVVVGRDEAGVKKAADTLGWREHSTSWEQTVARDDIDVVDICTPGDTHAPVAVAAAEAGKVVFCEKPLANTLPEAERMLDAVRRAGVTHMICHNYRYTTTAASICKTGSSIRTSRASGGWRSRRPARGRSATSRHTR